MAPTTSWERRNVMPRATLAKDRAEWRELSRAVSVILGEA